MENTTDTTTPVQFVERWLPDYEALFDNYLNAHADEEGNHKTPIFIRQAKETFAWHGLSKALVAYRDYIWQQACEAMREVCADIVLDLENGGYCEARTTYGRVERAEIPELPKYDTNVDCNDEKTKP